MIVSLLVAAAENNVIGKDNELPWKLPADMRFFMNLTTGHHIIMGRKTFESLKMKPLPRRTNIVITRNRDFKQEHIVVTHSLSEAIQMARQSGESEAFVIGGGEIYKQAILLADKIYLTRVHAEFEGDTFFPEPDPDLWQISDNRYYRRDEKNPISHSYQVFERSQPAH